MCNKTIFVIMISVMSTVAEIESAIESLPTAQVREIAAWLEQYQSTIDASAAVFSQLDAEEGEGDQWHEPTK
jgi:hypothetical protein